MDSHDGAKQGRTRRFRAVVLARVVVLWLTKPDEIGLREAARSLPDLLRLLKRLGGDPTMPKGVRVRPVLLLAYLALPST